MITDGWHSGFLILVLLIIMIVFGNLVVLLAVLIDRDLRRLATNKFIASLAISDLLVGIVVMPLSLYATVNEIHWGLGDHWCQFHLVTGVFSTTASIIHLTAISLDRYFAIMFPTEYQRHSIATSTFPYIIMIWLVSFAVSSTLFMEKSLDQDGFCWIENPQYLVLSSLLSFFIPGAIVIYLYVKIFRKLRSHRLYIFGQLDLLKRQQNNFSGRKNDKTQCLPRVIIQEAIGRRDSQLSQIGKTNSSNDRTRNGFLGQKLEVSSDNPKPHPIGVERRSVTETSSSEISPAPQWYSPSVCVETFKHVRTMTSKKRTSITSDPQSMELSAVSLNYQPVDNQCLLLDHLSLNSTNEEVLLKPFVASVAQSDSAQLPVVSVSFDDSKAPDDAKDSEGSLITPESPMLLTLPKPIDNFSPTSAPSTTTVVSLQVPKWDCCITPSSVPRSNSSRSTCTSTSGSDDTSRRISLHSFDTSITEDGTDSTAEASNSRKVSTWSMMRTIVMTPNTASLTSNKDPVTNNVPDSTPKATASRGRLRRIATQVTRAIRRKRRESLAIRRETRATGVVAAILIAFVICWIPYFCITVYRGVCTGLNIELNKHLHVNLFTVSSWLGYAHSCFNPIIYTCLNKNFRRTIKQMICCSCPKNRKSL